MLYLLFSVYIGLKLVIGYKNKDKFYSPINFVRIYILLYGILGPLILEYIGDVSYGNTNLLLGKKAAINGLIVSYLSIELGFVFGLKFTTNKSRKNSLVIHWIHPIILIGIGLIGWTYTRGIQWNIFEQKQEVDFYTGGFSYYFVMLISFFVYGVIQLLALWINTKQKINLLLLIIGILLAMLIFVQQGSRYRIVILVVAMLTTYQLLSKKRLKNGLILALGSGLVWIFGIIGQTRSYSRGLNMSRLENVDRFDIINAAVADSKVFFYSGLVIKESQLYYFQPIVTGLLMPIPRSIFPGKPDANYLKETQQEILNTSSIGAATLYYGEYYLTFGWIGIIIFSFLLGVIISRYWKRYLQNGSIYSVLSLSVLNGVLYYLITRGYIGQQVFVIVYFVLIPEFIWQVLQKRSFS